jgi:lactoylglutathione lyase
MHIEHIAIWTNDIERLKDFYIKYFGCSVSEKYENPKKQFSSYFLSFERGARLEIMKRDDIVSESTGEKIGLAHFSIAVGSEYAVDQMTMKMANDGVPVESMPRRTGDGYYESVILDPDKNRVEIMASKMPDQRYYDDNREIDDNMPVVVYEGDYFRANMVKNLLENEDIVSYITNDIVGTALPWHVAPGGYGAIKLTVALENYDKAKSIIDEFEKKLNE